MNAFIKLRLSGEAFPIDIGGTKTLRMMRFPIKSVFEPQNLPKTLCNWHLFPQFVASPFPFPQSQETVLLWLSETGSFALDCRGIEHPKLVEERLRRPHSYGPACASLVTVIVLGTEGAFEETNDGFPEFSNHCSLRYAKCQLVGEVNFSHDQSTKSYNLPIHLSTATLSTWHTVNCETKFVFVKLAKLLNRCHGTGVLCNLAITNPWEDSGRIFDNFDTRKATWLHSQWNDSRIFAVLTFWATRNVISS